MAAKPAVAQQVDALLSKFDAIDDPLAKAQKIKDEANQFFKGPFYFFSSFVCFLRFSLSFVSMR